MKDYKVKYSVRGTVEVPSCPNHSIPTHTVDTRYGLRTSCQVCDKYSWDLKPLVSPETHSARKMAHSFFDRIWRRRILSRGEAYKLLAKFMSIEEEDCHISLFNVRECKEVVKFSQEFFGNKL